MSDLPFPPLAFPVKYNFKGVECTNVGLTKLEYFAAHAPDVPEWFGFTEGVKKELIAETFFKWRKYYAEQMIKEFGG